MSQTYDFLKQCGTFWVSTINLDAPASRPFGAVMERNGHLYISTSNTKAVYRQFCENPAIQITAIKPGTRDWIRISGNAVEVTAAEDKIAMFEACPRLAMRYDSPTCDYFSIFKITDMQAFLCTDNGKERLD